MIFGPNGEPGGMWGGSICLERRTAARTSALVLVDAGRLSLDRRDVDMIIGVHAAMVLPRQFVTACATFVGVDIAGVIGAFRQTAGGALATLAPLLVRTLGTGGLLALGWRQRGIIRRLGRLSQLRLQFRDTGLQGRDLFHLR